MGCWSGSWVETAASASLNYFRLLLGGGQLRRIALARISCDNLEKDVCAHSIMELKAALRNFSSLSWLSQVLHCEIPRTAERGRVRCDFRAPLLNMNCGSTSLRSPHERDRTEQPEPSGFRRRGHGFCRWF